MKRKVIQLAGKTFVVSLPSKWAKQQGIKKGDEVNLEEQESKLILSSSSIKTSNKKELDSDKLEILTKRSLFRQYQEGADEIQINFSNPRRIQDIQEYLNELIGYEIVKQGKQHAIINDVSGQKQQEFDQIMRRLFLLFKGMIEDSITAFKEKDKEALKNIIYRDLEINKFTHFCLRLLSKQNIKQDKKMAYFTMLYTLERIGDDYKNMINYMTETKKMPDKEVIKLCETFHKFFTKTYEFTFNNKLSTAKDITIIHAQLRAKTKKYMETKNIQTGFFLHAITKSLITLQELQLPHIKYD